MRTYNTIDSQNCQILTKYSQNQYVCIDLETTGLNSRIDRILGISFAFDENDGYYCTNTSLLTDILSNVNITKVFHNAVFDLSFLKAAGIDVRGKVHDTMLMAHIVDPDRDSHGLKDIATKILGPTSITKATELYKYLSEHNWEMSDLDKVPTEMVTDYACEDVLNTFALFKHFSKTIGQMRKWMIDMGYSKTLWNCYLEEDCALIPVIVDMHMTGVKLDMEQIVTKQHDFLKRIQELSTSFPYTKDVQKAEKLLLDKKRKRKYIAKLEGWTNQLKDETDETKREKLCTKIQLLENGTTKITVPSLKFNWDSSDHLKTLIYRVLKEPVTKKTYKGNASMDADVLHTFIKKYDFVTPLLEYKELKKLSTTYLQNLIDLQNSGRIHANFNLTGTATGRLSSSKPNLQNIPKHGHIKQLFVASAGNKFIYADYSQLELRVAAHLSEDTLLLKAYKDNLDLHRLTASIIYDIPEEQVTDEQRSNAKTINFAIIYNASGFRVAQILGYMDKIPFDDKENIKKAAKRGDALCQKLFGKYNGLKKYVDKQQAQLLKYRVAITEFGRIRRLPKIGSDDWKDQGHAMKSGFNMYIQSFGASICKRAMIELHKQGFKLINQIHDAIIIEVPESETDISKERMQAIMQDVVKIKVPLIADMKILTSFQE